MTPPHLRLPPQDRRLSPLTGWTRAHWEATADQLLDALVPYATRRGAQYRLPGRLSRSGVTSDGLEGFARSFLLAAVRIAGAQGGTEDLIERYADGLAAGTDPRSGEAWAPITDLSQQIVEAASIAIGLHESRTQVWDRLDPAVQQSTVDWLSGVVGARIPDNNWRLFQVVVEQFLASIGAPHAQDDIDSGLERIEDWWVGDGWYTDGSGKNFDYYCGWMLQTYPLLWARIATATPGADTSRAEVYRERLHAFLTHYPQFFGGDGAPVHQGRSLVYRFACLAPVWMGELADCTPLPPGQARRLASATMRHFADRGVPDERGLLGLGWYQPYLPLTQPYSGPASPYWASSGFLGLLLPPDHAAWTAMECQLPLETADQVTALPAPGWLLHGTRNDGIVRLINHGSDHLPDEDLPFSPTAVVAHNPHYAKFAYSSSTAPESAPHAWSRNLDNHIALLAPDGTPSHRGRIHPLECSGARASSWHTAHLPGQEPGTGHRIETTSLIHGPWEIRVHRIDAPAGTPIREGGYAVACTEQPIALTGDGWALARNADQLSSAVVGLYGWDAAAVARETEANALGPHSATPYLTRAAHPAGHTVLVTLVALARDVLHPRALREAITVTVEDDVARIRLPEGTELQA
ncbi:hypothetical protein BIV57_01220 [Mangrovactinospora gilvigrisea]|uniref:DUF2264 domain-containing protein n=1 Tax=Mangrovactinospora gilvigrisea TaxID=1428644 RepID=A0A1J7BLF1_9ACTN|nr:DUF2264 domain-containing protein [Mangrovactinospora gilvigrisea]OIV39527.1 hypothetical protein BIV57_01220 [Mangrovactinospora gilvigrisea]